MKIRRTLPAYFTIYFLLGCVSERQLPIVEMPFVPDVENELSPAQMLASLDRSAPPDTTNGLMVKDVRHFLIATDLESRSMYKEAVPEWLESLKNAKGIYARKAFKGWVGAYLKTLDSKPSAGVLAKLIQSESKSADWLSSIEDLGLQEDDFLISFLKSEFTLDSSPQTQLSLVENADAIELRIDIGKDPLLIDAASLYCEGSRSLRNAVTLEIKKLESWRQSFWQAVVNECEGKLEQAASGYENIIAFPNKTGDHKAMALYTAYRLATINRRLGRRERVASAYKKLVELYNVGNYDPSDFNLSATAFKFKKIDDFLWASRYSALVGDWSHGWEFGQSALKQIENFRIKTPSLSPTERQKLNDLHAESYHVLASRIAIERKEFDSAISLTTLGLAIDNLSTDWQERFLWYLGLYNFMAGNFSGANRHWDTLLKETSDDDLKSRLYFWLGRTNQKLGLKTESEFFYDTLVNDYPLSYYSVIGLQNSESENPQAWKTFFEPHDKLVEKYESRKDYDLTLWRRHSTIGPLLVRAEILITAQIKPLLQLSVDELTQSTRKEYAMVEKNLSAFVYLSRLQYAAHLYFDSVSLTTAMEKVSSNFWQTWPDQMLIHFPRPYLSAFDRVSRDNVTIDPEVMLAISRRESTFRASVKSPAGAIGLMQIVPHTGKKYAREIGMSDSLSIEEILLNPENNIRLGGAYLKFLTSNYKNFNPAIFAAYNAGEFAVDQWLARRQNTDPLLWIETIPFGETKSYVKSVWRNLAIYQYISRHGGQWSTLPSP